MTMGTGTISFPGLGIHNLEINKVAFELFGIQFRWYGILIGIGFAVALLVGIWLRKKSGESVDRLLDVVIIATPCAIIGARIYYVLQTLDQYDSVWDYFKIWEGGLAFYGGLIGAVIAAGIYCWVRKENLLKILDCAAPAFLIAQAIGRWGNFVNQEAFGTATDLPWRMEIVIGGVKTAVHPTFLYESLWNLLGFVLLLLLFNKRKWNGEVFVGYLGWYGLGRAFIEGMRTDSLMLTETIRTSQWLAAICFVVAVIVLVTMRIKLRKKASKEADYTPQFAEAAAARDEKNAKTIDIPLEEDDRTAETEERAGDSVEADGATSDNASESGPQPAETAKTDGAAAEERSGKDTAEDSKES